jgi:hypothetical protein
MAAAKLTLDLMDSNKLEDQLVSLFPRCSPKTPTGPTPSKSKSLTTRKRSAGERSARVAAGKNLPRQIVRSETFPAVEAAQLALADQTPTRPAMTYCSPLPGSRRNNSDVMDTLSVFI